ncbi:hypothetical protein BV20DRAFT_146284 [Pilatotrama ljubarskyi]|nr:hypothetical protein BV20DRAFT_146284 [Pilatotrama ljubarskyi]
MLDIDMGARVHGADSVSDRCASRLWLQVEETARCRVWAHVRAQCVRSVPRGSTEQGLEWKQGQSNTPPSLGVAAICQSSVLNSTQRTLTARSGMHARTSVIANDYADGSHLRGTLPGTDPAEGADSNHCTVHGAKSTTGEDCSIVPRYRECTRRDTSHESNEHANQ